MAGPSIMVKVIGDLTGLGKSFDEAGSKGQSSAARMHSAFTGVLGTLNSSGVLGPFGASLATADAALQQVDKHSKSVGTTMIGVGGAAAGVGLALTAIGSKDAAAHAQLQAAVQATGRSYSTYSGQVDEAIKHQEHFGNTADTTQDSLRILTQATGDPTKALKLLGEASDLAAAKHEDLNTAAEQLGKAYNGAGRIFKEFGVTAVPTATQATKQLESATKASDAAAQASQKAHQHLSDVQAELAGKTTLTTAEHIKLRDATQNVAAADAKAIEKHAALVTAQDNAKNAAQGHNKAIDELGKKLAGQASAQADTFGGRLKALRAVVTDNIAQFGQKYGPAITAAGAAMTGFGAALEVSKVAMSALKSSTVIETAAQFALDIAASPFLIIIGLIVVAVGVLVGAIIYSYFHFKIFRDVINDVGKVFKFVFELMKQLALDVFNWLRQNWPLVLGIILGPFALAVVLIIKYWHQILDFMRSLIGDITRIAKQLWHWISDEFFKIIGDIVAIWAGFWTWLTGIPAAVTALAKQFWHWISDEFQNVITGIGIIWGAFWAWLTAIPAAIAGLALQFWHWIRDEFQNVVTGVQVIWGGIWAWLTGIPGSIAGLAKQFWHWISDEFQNVVTGVQTIWGGIWAWFTGLPSAIGNTAKGMWNGIGNAFVDAINYIIGAWDALHFHVPGFSFLGVHAGDFDLGLPQIPKVPHLAQGGLITETGLVYAHAGEAITPAPAGVASSGINIESVTLAGELDIDSFMRRLSWNVRTAAI